MDASEVVDDVLAPVGEMASLRAIVTETGEERLVGESIGAHSSEVAQPTESVGDEHVSDRADIATGSDGNGWLRVPSRVANRIPAKAAHLEGF
jgi:hypothetical protein